MGFSSKVGSGVLGVMLAAFSASAICLLALSTYTPPVMAPARQITMIALSATITGVLFFGLVLDMKEGSFLYWSDDGVKGRARNYASPSALGQAASS